MRADALHVSLLFDGRVLQSWAGQPELYDPASATWSVTGTFAFPDRGCPGHSDHSLLVLSDGRALAVGLDPIRQPLGEMTELFDPASGTWGPFTSPDLVRTTRRSGAPP